MIKKAEFSFGKEKETDFLGAIQLSGRRFLKLVT
jgi:hypothetical protein